MMMEKVTKIQESNSKFYIDLQYFSFFFSQITLPVILTKNEINLFTIFTIFFTYYFIGPNNN